MKKRIQGIFKKAACVVLACAVCMQLSSVPVFAKMVTWKLIHSPTGTSASNVISWEKTVTATKNTTTVYVNITSGSPTIQAQTSNGINRSFTAPGGAASASTKIGKRIKLSVYYTDYGSGYSAASGYFDY